eukprot:CAMPEP_0116062024 /NCGR_PEP_ID=MMETSP0322-20121206/7461_1 /TAXON_ID=163516 /ORGANISM="Leptocylindrus danicus var. apora, Strain B651" /LENGTH=347 /DNA_ID=CAMNT_0003547149 /DNA_START=35 /DNA_END=1078 /DNA_ORIENTATION=-
MGDDVPFYHARHVSYITSLASKLDAKNSYEGSVTEHLRMSGVYWSLAALSILKSEEEVDEMMGLNKALNETRPSIVDWVFMCYDSNVGGFGGNIGHDAHLLYTLSAVQILAIANRLDDERLDKKKVGVFVASLQQADGSFAGDVWGEIDTRFSYCALSTLSILGLLNNDDPMIDVDLAAEYVVSCRNFDGGFGCIPGAESHAGQIFCCIGALSLANALDTFDAELLSWWLCERQCDSGGLNGRPEKQADVCYSWWILSVLSILGRVDWINCTKLVDFILKCQDDEDGGIADRPDDMADVYHTFFGICGLSLMGHLQKLESSYRSIDPVYALPKDVVERLKLKSQMLR